MAEDERAELDEKKSENEGIRRELAGVSSEVEAAAVLEKRLEAERGVAEQRVTTLATLGESLPEPAREQAEAATRKAHEALAVLGAEAVQKIETRSTERQKLPLDIQSLLDEVGDWEPSEKNSALDRVGRERFALLEDLDRALGEGKIEPKDVETRMEAIRNKQAEYRKLEQPSAPTSLADKLKGIKLSPAVAERVRPVMGPSAEPKSDPVVKVTAVETKNKDPHDWRTWPDEIRQHLSGFVAKALDEIRDKSQDDPSLSEAQRLAFELRENIAKKNRAAIARREKLLTQIDDLGRRGPAKPSPVAETSVPAAALSPEGAAAIQARALTLDEHADVSSGVILPMGPGAPLSGRILEKGRTYKKEKVAPSLFLADLPVPLEGGPSSLESESVLREQDSGIWDDHARVFAAKGREELLQEQRRERDLNKEFPTHAADVARWEALKSEYPTGSTLEEFCQAGARQGEADERWAQSEIDVIHWQKEEGKMLSALAEWLKDRQGSPQEVQRLYEQLDQIARQKMQAERERDRLKAEASDAKALFDQAEISLADTITEITKKREAVAEHLRSDQEYVSSIDLQRRDLSAPERKIQGAEVEYYSAKFAFQGITQQLRGLQLQEAQTLLELKWKSKEDVDPLKKIWQERAALAQALGPAAALVREKNAPLRQVRREEGRASAARTQARAAYTATHTGIIKPSMAQGKATAGEVAAAPVKTFGQTLRGIPGMGRIMDAFAPIVKGLFGGG